MGYQIMSIKDAINKISMKQMYLPEIQRNFVWKEKQIEDLFDSIIMGYPIGTFLLWKTTTKNINYTKPNIYNFISDFHERDRKNNSKEITPLLVPHNFIYIVLDGQQRLSSFYMALKGSIAYKLPKCWWRVDGAFPRKELYFDLDTDLSKKVEDDEVIKRFKFMTDEQRKAITDRLWFKAREVFNFLGNEDIVQYAISSQLHTKQIKNLTALYTKMNDDSGNSSINYYEIEEADYDDVLNIFVRVNSSGTPLSKTDLLFSSIVAEWKGGRDEIEGLIKHLNKQGDEFNFSTDLIIRSCLALTDAPVSMKIESFKKSNIVAVMENWPRIKEAFILLSKFLVGIGFSDAYISSYNALIPILYYLFKTQQLTDANIREFKKYFIIAQVKNLFGVASNSAITETRKSLQEIDCSKTPFSLELFQNIRLTGDRNFKVSEDIFSVIFDYDLGPYTFLILSLLYPELKLSEIKWHQDHIHPYSGFETRKIKPLNLDKDKVSDWQKKRNKLPNLQLLEGLTNESKQATPLTEWLEQSHKVKYLPEGISYELVNFDEFYEKRKQLITDELRQILNIPPTPNI
ncbi:MAG TPA: DUF262 domain-containing protein [Bacilli bacterium]|nr:DUF262 domain-containing protein [Bacilli bacterium]